MSKSFFQFSANKVLIVTLTAVLLLAVPTYFSVVYQGEQSLPDSVFMSRSEGEMRSPSSIQSSTFEPKKSFDSKKLSAKFDIKCGQRDQDNFRHQSEYIQFHGEACVKNFNFQEMEITNRRNGYTASIFLIKKGKYQTDLIQLEPGLNEILVRYKNHAGQFIEEVIHSFRE